MTQVSATTSPSEKMDTARVAINTAEASSVKYNIKDATDCKLYSRALYADADIAIGASWQEYSAVGRMYRESALRKN